MDDTRPVYTSGPTTTIYEIQIGINTVFEKYGINQYVNVVTGKDITPIDLNKLQNIFPDHTIAHTGFGYYEVRPIK